MPRCKSPEDLEKFIEKHVDATVLSDSTRDITVLDLPFAPTLPYLLPEMRVHERRYVNGARICVYHLGTSNPQGYIYPQTIEINYDYPCIKSGVLSYTYATTPEKREVIRYKSDFDHH